MDNYATVSSHYDEEMDVLYVWLRQPAEVFCIEPEDGVALRFDAHTDEFVGYTIVDCRRRFAGTRGADLSLPAVPPFMLEPLRAVLSGGVRELQVA